MKIIRAIISLVLLVTIAICGFFVYRSCNNMSFSSCFSAITAEAKSVDFFTTVYDDLGFDENYILEHYPANDEDYTINVEQIAESGDGRLYLYIYCPSYKVVPSSVNISIQKEGLSRYKNYRLNCVDSSIYMLSKFLVEDFTVLNTSERYYEICDVYRLWDKTFDDGLNDDNVRNEVAYEVGKSWTLKTENGNTTVSSEAVEYVVIRPGQKHVGFLRYENGFNLNYNACDSHYIAFTCDHKIDELLEADVYFVTQESTEVLGMGETLKDRKEQYAYFSNEDTASNPAGLFGCKYTWNRIESVSDFVSKENLTDETKQAISDKQWVLRFYESQYWVSNSYYVSIVSTVVTDVTILRLRFKTDNNEFDFGVVDDKQSGDTNPDGGNRPGCGDSIIKILLAIWRFIKKHWKWILLAIAAVIVIGLIVRVIKWIVGK